MNRCRGRFIIRLPEPARRAGSVFQAAALLLMPLTLSQDRQHDRRYVALKFAATERDFRGEASKSK